ncbi:MAG: glycine dehydrogenase, partial [Candidatus Aldehydirespiratoraceae bacterium]
MTNDDRPTLIELEGRDAFVSRHIGPPNSERAIMLAALGLSSISELIDQTVPEDIRMQKPLNLPSPIGQQAAQDELREIASANRPLTSLIGMGYHDTHTPPVIRRNIMENPGWYTAYTPYQPEISQGRLEALLNFQTMVSELSGMDLANASLLDEGTAAAEAMTMLHRISRGKAGDHFLIDTESHPQTIGVVQTRAEPIGLATSVGDPLTADLDGVYAVLVQYPGSTGAIPDLAAIIERCHASNTLVAVAADPLALTVLTPPGHLGADVVLGSTQRFGVPMGFGGPHAAYFAVREAHQRSLPGRLVGVSIDAGGRKALRLALQTREQHIRREKATSNICTSQVLLAVMASMYALHHGPVGLRRIARRINRLAAVLAQGLRDGGIEIVHDNFFDTVCARVPGRADKVMAIALAEGVNLRRVDANTVSASLDETTGRSVIETVWHAFGVDADLDALDSTVDDPRPEELRRTTPALGHPIFSSCHSETELVRYMRKLVNRDIALDRSMIPLGSCTMKLN